MNTFHLSMVLVRLMGAYWVLTYGMTLARSGVEWVMSGRYGGGPWDVVLFGAAHYVAGMGVGVALFLKAAAISRLVCRGLFPEGCCQRCGYNLAVSGLAKCPECGHQEPAAGA